MKNFLADGNTMTVTAPAGGYASGDLVIIGDTIGIATKDAAEGEDVALALEGVYQLPKAAATAIGQGVKVYWKADPGEVTTTATANTLIGRAHAAAADAAAVVDVKIMAKV